ncbi:MAG: hypothetical protein NT068_02510 [Candidatus Nomurabacteria bacterium]|nr:hypothetical protein [Candidatus Nomurabacteria bacterium]
MNGTVLNFVAGINVRLATGVKNAAEVFTVIDEHKEVKSVKFPGGMGELVDEEKETWLKAIEELAIYYKYPAKVVEALPILLSQKEFSLIERILVRKFLKETGMLPIAFKLVHTQQGKGGVNQNFFLVYEVTHPSGVEHINSPDLDVKIKGYISNKEVDASIFYTHGNAWDAAKKTLFNEDPNYLFFENQF